MTLYDNTFSKFLPSFLNWNEIINIKKISKFNSTGSLRQCNGLYQRWASNHLQMENPTPYSNQKEQAILIWYPLHALLCWQWLGVQNQWLTSNLFSYLFTNQFFYARLGELTIENSQFLKKNCFFSHRANDLKKIWCPMHIKSNLWLSVANPTQFIMIGGLPCSNPNLAVIGNGGLWNRIWYPILVTSG